MLNDQNITPPAFYQQIKVASEKLGFNMLSDLQTGSLLRTLSAAKPGGRFLELGTGTGLSLAWLAEGADQGSTIISIDNSDDFQKIARDTFKGDKRIHFECTDGNQWILDYNGEPFDLIFADAWPGKYDNLDKTLSLVKPGGFYFIDDMLPQSNWPDGHAEKADILMETLAQRKDFVFTTFNWSTGLMLFTKIR